MKGCEGYICTAFSGGLSTLSKYFIEFFYYYVGKLLLLLHYIPKHTYYTFYSTTFHKNMSFHIILNWRNQKGELFKGIAYLKIKLTHYLLILGVYDLLLSDEYNQSYIYIYIYINVLALLGFIMTVTGGHGFEKKINCIHPSWTVLHMAPGG